ncbi:aldehyde dehydrogenase family protein [Serratia marcescens]|nr:aldehyde dehydrogenase family protein [Serratia marcescens]RTG27789.1 aldehyde dehydrogenase family protein [Serratia marcescens]
MQSQLLIDGQLVNGQGATQPVYNPATGEVIAQVAEASPEQVDRAVLAADAAFAAWGQTTPKERAEHLLKLADLIDEHAETFARLESLNCGKPYHCVLNDELPAVADVFRFFAGASRCLTGMAAGEYLAGHTSMIRRDPLGVVASIAPWNYPLMMAAWKLAPALAGGNCVVLKPAEQTPLGISVLMEEIGDLLPPGVLNVVQGFGAEAGEALARSKRIEKIAFTGSTPVGRHILACAAENIIPSTVELGGKSPNIYFEDIMQAEPAFIDKAVEGLVLGFFNQGEVCTCPSRALIQESIYPQFMEKVLARIATIRQGDPFDTETMIGAQASKQQYDKILSYIEIAKNEGGKIVAGGEPAQRGDEVQNGFYLQPTLITGNNSMRFFREEIFGPVIGVTTFKDEAEALALANDTEFGLGAGLWTRDINRAYRMGRAIKAGRVWTNCYHLYPAHAAFGGYKNSGIGRETHKAALSHYQQVKNLLVSYDAKPLGLF